MLSSSSSSSQYSLAVFTIVMNRINRQGHPPSIRSQHYLITNILISMQFSSSSIIMKYHEDMVVGVVLLTLLISTALPNEVSTSFPTISSSFIDIIYWQYSFTVIKFGSWGVYYAKFITGFTDCPSLASLLFFCFFLQYQGHLCMESTFQFIFRRMVLGHKWIYEYVYRWIFSRWIFFPWGCHFFCNFEGWFRGLFQM